MKNEIKYKTAGGSVIVWNGVRYTCGGCGDESRSDRSKAQDHAKTCKVYRSEEPVNTEIRYKTAGGNAVVWKRSPKHPGMGPNGRYTCGGCGDERRSYPDDARRHADGCQAL